tara:strand:- start:769 stop:1581 length:813 start_codon:yes stop_codon:yes gene_type:complete
MATKNYIPYAQLDAASVKFMLGTDRIGKTTITMTYGPQNQEVALVSSPAVTMWPRCSGDGNYGTMWGPTDVSKAKYTLDLTDYAINDAPNEEFNAFRKKLEEVDDALLHFVTDNQLKVLGRRNLSTEEVKMLQIRSVRPKYDKLSGALNGHTLNCSTAKFRYDGMGGKMAFTPIVCDMRGATIPNGHVSPGDIVAATIYANLVYTGVGGDKFGIHWGFTDVSVICQRTNVPVKLEVEAFKNADWSFGRDYVDLSEPIGDTYNATDQFGSS